MTRAERLAAALLAWGHSELRDLPWRRTRDPWAILVAETMLQQTQAGRVAPRWEAFLRRFPTPAACAAAAPADVVMMWDGLGYNRRALYLHRAATVVTIDHGGQVPVDLEALLALPGVGPYTARAILAFAFEHPGHGPVDTNIARVLARAVAGRTLRPREVQALADDLVPGEQPWLWNQAVMELGAVHCSKRAPACPTCPVAAHCAWRRDGGDDPADGTAGTSGRQSTFEGSDRQGRGRLVAAMRAGPVAVSHVTAVTGWQDDPDRARRVAWSLVDDGLAVTDGDHLTLPGP